MFIKGGNYPTVVAVILFFVSEGWPTREVSLCVDFDYVCGCVRLSVHCGVSELSKSESPDCPIVHCSIGFCVPSVSSPRQVVCVCSLVRLIWKFVQQTRDWQWQGYTAAPSSTFGRQRQFR